MSKFEIKSSIHNYHVSFVDNFKQILNQRIKVGDVIIFDKTIIQLYPDILKKIPSETKHYVIVANEQQKSYQGIEVVIEFLIRNNFRKNNRLIAIGGGIVQDVTAFIASIMYRGVEWLFFPTTLLSQCDSCIGSKTSVNFGEYKNQIGGFYPPNEIVLDQNFLKTLSDFEMKSGIGEMLHYYVIGGKSDFEHYAKDYSKALTDFEILKQLIYRSLEIKKSYIEIDEYDRNERQVFNYGHSFGHAIETTTNYRIPHGIAVSLGMDIANYIAVQYGILNNDTRNQIKQITSKIYEGIDLMEDFSFDKFCTALSRDKKNVGKQLGIILIRDIGKAEKMIFDFDEEFTGYLNEYFINKLYL